MAEPGRLFDPDEHRSVPEPVVLEPGQRIVRVLPDVSGIDREFDYLAAGEMAERLAIGSLVRIDLHGRRVAGWITMLDPEPDPAIRLRPLVKVSSVGPPKDIVDMARWAADRWCGRLATILKTASPPKMVRAFPRARPTAARRRHVGQDDPFVAEALAAPGITVVRVSPIDDQFRFIEAASDLGDTLVVVPSVARARRLSGRLGRLGIQNHLHPTAWANGPAGGVVIGSRSSVWAPTGELRSILVLDEHDESLQEERVPTWHARDVAIERARRAGVPCLLVSPAPSLAATRVADRVLSVSRSQERAGWPAVEVIDQRSGEPGQTGLFSSRVAVALREPGTAIAVLNRKGRARMLACGSCGELIKTEDGEHLMIELEGRLSAPQTGETRPLVCAICTGTHLKRLRLGVTRAAEELNRLVGRPVVELSSETKADDGGGSQRLVLGTEAALHAITKADTIVFLDFDQELHAPRYRAAEQALWLLVRAARVVGGRRSGARILIQTRSPEHRVLQAAVAGDPGRLLDAEIGLRQPLGFPPMGALAEISGAGAEAFAEGLYTNPLAQVLGPRNDGRYLLRAEHPDQLASILRDAPRPKERLRVSVDPPRV